MGRLLDRRSPLARFRDSVAELLHGPPVRDELGLLVSRLRSGFEQEETARRLDAALRPRLQRYFQAGGVPAARAEDLVQQTLIRVFQHVGSLQSEDRFLPWLFAIARNVARTEFRQGAREHEKWTNRVDLEGVADGTSTEAQRDARARLSQVERAMQSLPERQRRCLVMVVRDELSYQEVADLLALSPLTVRNHLAAARRRLRELLAGERGGP